MIIDRPSTRKHSSICLVLCPVWSKVAPPGGLALLSATLRKQQYTITVFDFNNYFYQHVDEEDKYLWNSESFSLWWNPQAVERLFFKYPKLIQEMKQQILNTSCTVVGFSTTADNRFFTLELAKQLKAINPALLVFLGGPDTSPYWEGNNLIKHSQIDALFVHDADDTLPLAIKMLSEQGSFSKMPGLVFKQAGEIIDGGLPLPVNDLNAAPFPDYSDFDFFLYEHSSRLDVMGSRGCVNKCNHCPMTTLYPNKFNMRSAKHIFDEIVYQLERHPQIDLFSFNDCLINGNISILNELCDLLIAKKLPIKWEAQAIIRKEMSLQLLQKMSASGCRQLVYGIETGSNKILRYMNRRHYSVELAQKVLRDTWRANIKVLANFMFGYPGETESDFIKTINFVKRNRPYFAEVSPQQSFTAILRGSYLYEHAAQFNIEENPHALYWMTKDMKNTYPIRFYRYKRFWELCKNLKIPTVGIFHVSQSLLGDYYWYKQDFQNALECYKHDIQNKAYTEDMLKASIIGKFAKCCKQTNAYTKENMEILNKYIVSSSYKASIVIATMDRGEKLIQTLDSLVALDFPYEQYEIIIIDQMPSSANRVLIDNYTYIHPQHHIKYIATNEFGLSWARNRGIIESAGEILVFLDDDALAEKHWLENILVAFAKHPLVYAVGGKVISQFVGGQPKWVDARLKMYLSDFDKGNTELYLTYNDYPRGANCAFRREAFVKCGLFIGCLGLKGKSKMTYEEIEMCFRLEKGGYRIMYISDAEVQHLIRSERLCPRWFKHRFYWQGRSEALFMLLHQQCKSGLKLLVRHSLFALRERDMYQRYYHVGYVVTLVQQVFFLRRYALCK